MRSLILSSFFKPATDNFLNRFSDSRSSPHSHLRLRLARARIIYSRDCSEEGPGTGCYWWGVRYFDLNLNPCALCFIKRSLLKDMVWHSPFLHGGLMTNSLRTHTGQQTTLWGVLSAGLLLFSNVEPMVLSDPPGSQSLSCVWPSLFAFTLCLLVLCYS